MQGHWPLASLGKTVLRPGGISLTRRLLEVAGHTPTDCVVEPGPGVGRTAEILLSVRPASYRGITPSPGGASRSQTSWPAAPSTPTPSTLWPTPLTQACPAEARTLSSERPS